ncbi:Smr/MutS family protein [Defluviicoccus vanus]|uniref:Smr/MutS family protein n=1 Tax=Defluviicoccus vanus TaxID=111831 RepID=A0A7H1N3T1_9PROT|nr:Smr/MutS family protein [Defluviicoccus vanus]QNT70367.1 Smr/MutS family protein [Defluviicoccus vanus]
MPPSPSPLAPGSAAGLDQRTLLRLKRGLLRPQTQIDLHRMTQGEAHAALGGFLARAQQAGRRCVLVITGKGYGSDGAVGVLKTNVPRWLNEQPNRERILAFAFAASQDGGEGALYVLLRRLRTSEPPVGPTSRRR